MRGVPKFVIAPAGPLLATSPVIAGQELPASAATGTLLATTNNRAGPRRTGQPVRDNTDARICGGTGPGLLELVENGPMYVVPSPSSLFSFGYLAQGQGATLSGFPPAGLPASPGGVWTTSHLAKVTLTVRSGE